MTVPKGRHPANDETGAVREIRDAAGRFLAECARASDAQWVFRPAPNSWSMAEVTEHVALSNRNVLGVLSGPLLDRPLSGATGVVDAEIPYLFYRGEEPPNVAAPTGAWTDRSAAADAFQTSVRAVLDWAGESRADLRSFGLAHPAFGLLDGVQWLIFIAAHTERHRAQLLGIRGHRDFPG